MLELFWLYVGASYGCMFLAARYWVSKLDKHSTFYAGDRNLTFFVFLCAPLSLLVCLVLWCGVKILSVGSRILD